MIELEVHLKERSYPIFIDRGILADTGRRLQKLIGPEVVVVTNPTVARIYLNAVLRSLKCINREARTVLIPDGEKYKTLETFQLIQTELLKLGCDRHTTLLALGGGVVGDLAGFAAATYQRGIDFVQIPTTLLAQVDSSVGGKTGVNHSIGKNMIGAFHQPRAVYVDTACLDTLPDREYFAGLAEVIKYGMIHDAAFFTWIEARRQDLLARNPTVLAEAIRRSCEIKAVIVGVDERESGTRALLNFGHTFGHAIEAGLGYGTWLHGEAVAAGMVLATAVSAAQGLIEPSVTERLGSLLQSLHLPTEAPALGADRYLELMAHDKKNQAGTLRIVLLQQLGRAFVQPSPSESILRQTLEAPPRFA